MFIDNLWPEELALENDRAKFRWSQSNSNIVLDLHGDPCKAKICLLSDGNHHMALQEILSNFLQHHPKVVDIFYTTTPPRILYQILHTGGLQLANLSLSISPDMAISPKNMLSTLQSEGYVSAHRAFMYNRGCVLLINQGNPKNISGPADLFRDDITLFISNPDTETVSFNSYYDALFETCREQGLNTESLKHILRNTNKGVIHGQQIHHREALYNLVNGKADVAVLYYHLALRYKRIVPDAFEIIPLQDESHDNVSADNAIHAGLINDGGEWGKTLFDYLFSQEVAEIYKRHGLSPIDTN